MASNPSFPQNGMNEYQDEAGSIQTPVVGMADFHPLPGKRFNLIRFRHESMG
jgi:hypothetical protein